MGLHYKFIYYIYVPMKCKLVCLNFVLQIEKLQAILSDQEILKFNFVNFDPLPLPLDPDVKVKGIVPDKASLFTVIHLIIIVAVDVRLCVCLSVCLSVCVHDNSKHIVVYENSSDEFDIGHCPIKVKVMA